MSHQPHDDHDRQHGPDCGHVAVPHGHHVDYIHDGHWDEHRSADTRRHRYAPLLLKIFFISLGA